ncbi:MAG: glycosyltransferase family 2 protein [Candidatus Hodarchaeota archaeon]
MQLVSIIIPAFNEKDTIKDIAEDTFRILNENGYDNVEILLIDDGSTDGTTEIGQELAQIHNYCRLISFRNNRGKTTAVREGFREARGQYIGIIDADYQFDPPDFLALLEPLIKNEADFVNGKRKKRKDPLTKRIPSFFWNRMCRWVFGIKLKDWNSGIKVMRRECIQGRVLREGSHRYLPGIISSAGFRVIERPISHQSRKFGKSKYGRGRLIRGLMDLISLKLRMSFEKRPMTLFGIFGMILLIAGFFCGGYLVYLQQQGEAIGDRPLLLLSILLLIFGFQLFSLGFIADYLANTLAETQELRRDVWELQKIMKRK